MGEAAKNAWVSVAEFPALLRHYVPVNLSGKEPAKMIGRGGGGWPQHAISDRYPVILLVTRDVDTRHSTKRGEPVKEERAEPDEPSGRILLDGRPCLSESAKGGKIEDNFSAIKRVASGVS